MPEFLRQNDGRRFFRFRPIFYWYQLELVKPVNCLIGTLDTDNLAILKFQNFQVDL